MDGTKTGQDFLKPDLYNCINKEKTEEIMRLLQLFRVRTFLKIICETFFKIKKQMYFRSFIPIKTTNNIFYDYHIF